MDKRGVGFVTIMIIIAISALLLRIAIENIVRVTIVQNEADAQATLKLISAALENYAKEHLGVFPEEFSLLTKDSPPYLEKDYVNASPVKGYDYNCARLDSGGYTCSAAPIKCKLTGKMNYTITTGGLLISEECK